MRLPIQWRQPATSRGASSKPSGGVAAEETSTLQLEPSKAAKKRRKRITRNGAPCNGLGYAIGRD